MVSNYNYHYSNQFLTGFHDQLVCLTQGHSHDHMRCSALVLPLIQNPILLLEKVSILKASSRSGYYRLTAPSSISLPTATCIHGFHFLVLCNSAPWLSTFASPTNSLESPTSLILFLTQIISLSIQPLLLQVTIVISFLDTSTTTLISTSTSWRYITVRPGEERYLSFPLDGMFKSESTLLGPPKQSIGLSNCEFSLLLLYQDSNSLFRYIECCTVACTSDAKFPSLLFIPG